MLSTLVEVHVHAEGVPGRGGQQILVEADAGALGGQGEDGGGRGGGRGRVLLRVGQELEVVCGGRRQGRAGVRQVRLGWRRQQGVREQLPADTRGN